MSKFKLKQLLSIKNGRDHKELNSGNIPIYGSGGIMRYGNKAIYNYESILLPRKGTLANIQYVNKPFWTVDTIYYSIVNKKLANPFYLFNFLKLLDLSKLNTGTSVPSMTFDSYYNLDIDLPELSIQQKIASVLSSLDAKIELNNRINSELEKMAKTLYDYWFVQFDFPDENGKPYKSSGGAMVWNAELKRAIPAGWEVLRMNKLLSKNIVKFNFDSNKSIDTIDLSVMPSSTMCLNQKNSSDFFSTNLFILNKFDILFGAIRPYLLKAGFSPFDGLVTGTVHSFKTKNKNFYNFVLLTMVSNSMFDFAISNCKGTKMPVIGTDDLLSYKVAFNEQVAIKFNNLFEFKHLIANNIKQNQTLANLRNWLLPMLMNGQIKVPF